MGNRFGASSDEGIFDVKAIDGFIGDDITRSNRENPESFEPPSKSGWGIESRPG
jgi:hypothetical protein